MLSSALSHYVRPRTPFDVCRRLFTSSSAGVNHTIRARTLLHLRRLRKRRQAVRFRRALLAGGTVIALFAGLTVPAFAAGSVGALPAVTGMSTSNQDQHTLIFDPHGSRLREDLNRCIPLNLDTH